MISIDKPELDEDFKNEQKTCANPKCDVTSRLFPKYRIEDVMTLPKEKPIRVCESCISPFRSYIRKDFNCRARII